MHTRAMYRAPAFPIVNQRQHFKNSKLDYESGQTMHARDQRQSGRLDFIKDAAGETPVENALVMLIVAVVSLLALMVVLEK